VVRLRALPLLTTFESASGPRQVWTTFSADQVDLNFKNPRVLLAVMDALLHYVGRGARFIRLDAIAFLWKELGTPCLHLPQVHQVVQLMRAVLDCVAPHVLLITETNVPHADNVSDFGDGHGEAQMVYNFALPPLVLHTLATGDATVLARWASTLRTPSSRNDRAGVEASGIARRINRQKLDRGRLEGELADASSIVARVFRHYGALLRARRNHAAFHPQGAQHVLDLDGRVFGVLRTSIDGSRQALCLHNVSDGVLP
jgi:glycosidase